MNMRDYPKGVLRVYDNHGKTLGRYTVYFRRYRWHYGGCKSVRMHEGVSMNESPSHPQGIRQFTEGQLGRHNGLIINFADLPPECQKFVSESLG